MRTSAPGSSRPASSTGSCPRSGRRGIGRERSPSSRRCSPSTSAWATARSSRRPHRRPTPGGPAATRAGDDGEQILAGRHERVGATRIFLRPPSAQAGLEALAIMKFVVTVGDTSETVEVSGEAGRYRLTIGAEVWEVDGRLTAQGIYSLLVGGVSYVADVRDEEGACVVDIGDERYVIRVEEQTRFIIRTKGGAAAGHGAQTLVAPLPGRIVHVAVKPGDPIEKGDTLLVIEA